MRRFGAARFDGQADTHDARTGIPEDRCAQVARAVAALTGAQTGAPLLDLGAGTGLPGAWIPDAGFRYLGLDASAPMLARFTARRPVTAGALALVRADIDQSWPVADVAVAVVFSSRAAHLFARAHLVREARRVTRPGGAFVLGRVRRASGSLRRRLRDEMRARLVARGFSPVDAGQAHREILDALHGEGATPLPTLDAATWQAHHSASQVLTAWTRTGGLGGCALAPPVKDEILTELWAWVREHVESADAMLTSEECFTLEGVRLP